MNLEDLYRLLRSGHVQAQGIVDTLQEPLVVLDQGFGVLNANHAFYRTFKSDRESTLGRNLFELGNGQWDIPELRKLLAEVVPKAAAIVGYEVAHNFPDLGQRTMLLSARRLVHPDDYSTQMLLVFEDVTERRKTSVAKDILVAETRHRMKNLMAMLRAVARQTQAEGRTGEEFRDSFMGRFEAVLNAQEFISANGSQTDLAELVSQTLQPVAGPRAKIGPGPSVSVSEHQVTLVTMILHELLTNALKYGALSNQTGIVQVNWDTESREGQTRVVLDWREEGGPPVEPPSRRGFGTELIEYSAKAEGGEAMFEFGATGLVARITLAVA